MSIIQRKPRPLIRDHKALRDDRLFIVACDDTYAPEQYFGFFRLSRVQIHVIPTTDGTSYARYVLDRLLEIESEEDDEKWMLLDTDHLTDGTHRQNFIQIIQEAKQRGINVALSRPCFELFLLLHHIDESDVVSLQNAKEAENQLRKTLGEYNKKKLKEEHYPLSTVTDACKRAERLDQEIGGGDIPDGNTTRVYKLWSAIVEKALPTQLPSELLSLKDK